MYQLVLAVIVVLLGALPAAAQYNVAPTTCTAGQYLLYDGTTWNCTAPSVFPSGMVAPFKITCPTGWTEETAARGRAIVGLPLSGTMGGTVGAALTDLQDKSVSLTHAGAAVADHAAHTHSVTSNVAVADHASHTHSVTSNVSVNDHASHTHTYNTVIAHTHGLSFARGATTGSVTTTQGFTSSTDTSSTAITDVTNSTGSASGTTAGPGATLTHTTNNPAVVSAGPDATQTHNVTNNAVVSGNPSATLTHAVTQPNAHTVATSDILSTIQYRMCSKD